MNTNTPSGSNVTGIKKPVFGSKFRSNVETIKQVPTTTIKGKNFKPRFDLSAIDYSDIEPHTKCVAHNNMMFDFWSTNSRFEIYAEKPIPAKPLDDLQCPAIETPEGDWAIPEPPRALPEPDFDFSADIFKDSDDAVSHPPAFPSISFDDF